MSGSWKLFSVGVELRKQGNVFVIARDALEAIDVAEDQLDIQHLGDFEEPEFDEPIEVDLTAEAVAKIAREEWAGPPYLAGEAPGELDVDMNRLVAALPWLETQRAPPGGCRPMRRARGRPPRPARSSSPDERVEGGQVLRRISLRLGAWGRGWRE